MQANSWHHKLFHFHLYFWIWKVWRGRENLENKNSFLDEIKNIFHSFWQAITCWKNKFNKKQQTQALNVDVPSSILFSKSLLVVYVAPKLWTQVTTNSYILYFSIPMNNICFIRLCNRVKTFTKWYYEKTREINILYKQKKAMLTT